MEPLIVANWKMNPITLAEVKNLFNSVKNGIKNIKNAKVVICPPFVYLSNIQYLKSNIKLGAQDCFWEEKGAFTGEISPLTLKNLGCEYVIIGHSERRKLGETDEMINKKIKAALSAKLKPILCIGETGEERKQGKTFKVLKNQLKNDLKYLISNIYYLKSLIIAYEPVWAIGTGNSCEPREAKKVYLFLRKISHQLINSRASYNSEGICSGSANKLLYGGSVNSENAASYIQEANFQGLLVGGASLNAQEFIKIVKSIDPAPILQNNCFAAHGGRIGQSRLAGQYYSY